MTAVPTAACNIPSRRGRVANTVRTHRNDNNARAALEYRHIMYVDTAFSSAAILEVLMKQNPANKAEPKVPPKPLDASSTYQVEGRTFVVQPVFQTEGNTTLATLLLNLMQADATFK